jgi:flagellar motility protein MotE (MotC chaperone)
MADDLNDLERRVRDTLKKHLGARATVTKVQQQADRFVVGVVSPNDFHWAAGVLEEIGPELAATVPGGLDINLTTWWSSKQ